MPPTMMTRGSQLLPVSVVAVAIAVGALTSTSGQAQGNATQRRDQAALRTLHVQGNVHVVLGAGANVVVQLGNLGSILVDTGTAQNAERVIASVRELTPRPVRYIINTHSHADHVGGNERIGASGVPLSGRGVAQVGAGNSSAV